MHRKCQCCYIPPHVSGRILRNASDMLNIRKESLDSLRASELGARSFRQSRKVGPEMRALHKQVEPIVEVDPDAADGARFVFDCQNSETLRFKQIGSENDPPVTDSPGERAFEASGIVRDFLANVLGRNSIDGQGMNIVLNVHYSQGYANAFWDGDEMTFGDGDGQIFVNFAKSLDVVAHELAHGVTEFTAGLDYYAQSGALNEHFSDVFGTAITQHDLNQTVDSADWLIGNEIMGTALAGETLRSMKAPGTAYSNALMGDDPQPAHMRDYYSGEADFRGVHINSGIPNRVFYLVACDQLGTARAAQLWYHTLVNLWPTANFADFAAVLINTTQVMTGRRALPQGTTQTVRLALKDVGLV